MAKFFKSTADIVPIDYENRPEGFLENVVLTPQNVVRQKPDNIFADWTAMPSKPASYTGTDEEWAQEVISGEPFQNLKNTLLFAKEKLDSREGTDDEFRAIAQNVVDDYEAYMGGVKRDHIQRLSGYTLSADGREWNSWKPCKNGYEVLNAVFTAITTSGKSMASDKVRRYGETLARVRQQYEEEGKPFTEQDQRAFDERMAVALGYAKQEEFNIEKLKQDVEFENEYYSNSSPTRAGVYRSYAGGMPGMGGGFPQVSFKEKKSSAEIEQEAKKRREENVAKATGKMFDDADRDRSVLTWLECADALSSRANSLIARAFYLGGDDEKVAGLGDAFHELGDNEKGTVAHFVGLSRGKVLEGQWWTDTGRGLYRNTVGITTSARDFLYAWGRVPCAYMMGAIKGENVSWQALGEETAKKLADDALWESSTDHLEYEDYSFVQKGLKGAVEQLPIWGTLMLGGGAGLAVKGVGAGMTALRMASAGAAVARTAGLASKVAGWGGKAMLAMWYANESMDRYVSEGAPLWRANVLSTLSGVGQAFCDSVQGEMLLGKGLMGRPFASARNQFCNLLAESGAHSFLNYMGVLAKKEGLKAVANLSVGASLDVLGECYVEGVQKSIETLGLNLAVDDRELLQDVAQDFWAEFSESVPTMVFSVGAGHAVSTTTTFNAKQTFASYNEAIRSMRSLSGVFAKERLPAQNVEFSIFTQGPDGKTVMSDSGLQKLRVAWLETKGNKERMRLLEGTRTGLNHSQAEMINRLFMAEERIRRVGTVAHAIKLGLASRTRTGESFMWTPEGITASIQAILPDAKVVHGKDGASVISINGIAIRLGRGDLNADIEANIENPTSGFLSSLWAKVKNTEHGKQFESFEDFEKKVGEKGDKNLREKIVRSTVTGGSGSFKGGLGTVEIDGKKVPIVGDITIDKQYAKGTTTAHEIVHATAYILHKAGVLTDEHIKDLRAMFGDPTQKDELFNEEAAAEAIESYIKVGGFLEEAEQKAGIGVKVAKPNAFNRVLQLLGDAIVSMGMSETEYNPVAVATDPKVLSSYARGARAQAFVRSMDGVDFTRLSTDVASDMAEPLRQEKANLASLVENPVQPEPRAETAETTEQTKPEGATENQEVQPTQTSVANEVGAEMSSPDEEGAVVAENATTEPVAEGEPVGNSDELSGNTEQLTEEQTDELSGKTGELPAEEEQVYTPTPVGKPTAEAEALSEKTGVRADVIAQVAQVALGDTVFQAVEGVDEAKEAQDKEDADKASNTVIDAFFDVKRTAEDVPVDNILVNDRIMQFKRGADPKTGTTDADFIPKYIPSMSRPIRVMQFNDGKIEVITGRHRLDAARRSGLKTIPAIVYREADGMTIDLAKAIDATENVIDRKGSAQDWVSFFKNSGLTSQELDQLGIHGGVKNKKVRAAEAIGTNGIDDVVSWALDPSTSETRFQALGAIARSPKGVQRALLDAMLNKGIVDPVQLERMGKVLADKVSSPNEEQGGLFGEDDEALEYARIEGLGVSKIIRGLERERDTLGRVIAGYKDMVLRDETKKRLGIKDVNDKEELIKAQEKVKLEIAEWQGVLSKEQTEQAYAIGKEEDEKAQKAKKDQTADLAGSVRVLLHNGKRQSTKSVGEKSFILEALSRAEDGLAPSVEDAFAKMLAEKDEAIKTEKSLAKKRPQISQRARIEKARDAYLKDKDSWQLSTVAEEAKKKGARYSLNVTENAPSPDAITQAEREAHEVWAQYHDANGNPKPGYRMAPSGKPSNLTEKQWIWVRTPSFVRWFGDWANDPENASKVVDKNGEPLVVYHGTKWDILKEKPGSAAFKNSLLKNTSEGWGFYFTKGKALAESYGDPVACFLSIKNPKKAKDKINKSKAQMSALLHKWKLGMESSGWKFYDAKGFGLSRDLFSGLGESETVGQVLDGLLDARHYIEEGPDGANYSDEQFISDVRSVEAEVFGFDGYADEDYALGIGVYVALRSNQVKSATENVGTFEPDNADIRYSLAEAETIANKLEEERKKVEANGGKLVLAYHGTDHRGFTRFEKTDNVGYYFAGTRNTAGSYIHNAGEEALGTPGLVDYQEATDFLRNYIEDGSPRLETKWVFKQNDGSIVQNPRGEWNGYATKEEAEAAKNADKYWKDHATVVKVDLLVDKHGEPKFYENGIPYQDVVDTYTFLSDGQSGIYDVAIRMDNPLEIDAEGRGWNNIYNIPRDENTKVYTEVSVWFNDEKGKVILLCEDEFGEETQYEYDWVDDLLEGVEKNFGKAMRSSIDAEWLGEVLDSGHSMDLFSKFQNAEIYVYNEREKDGLVVSQKSTREIETEAKEAGYDGVIIHNVVDVGGGLGSDEVGEDTVYISFNPSHIKSIDKITYADDGSIIPISQRLNWDNDGDLRYSLATPMDELRRDAENAGKLVPTGVQKSPGVYYPDASEDVRALSGKRYSFATDAEAIIKKKRPDVQDVPAVVSELQKFETSAERKAALHWFVRGTIRLPEDAPKVTQALGYAKRAKADALKYDSPMACMEDLHDFKPKAEPINPDTVPELTNKQTFDYGVTVYDVQDDRAGQRAMRRIINTHFGEDANPWCLLQGDGKGNLTEDAWGYWNHYNAIPKRVVFKDGKLVCFIANEDNALACWNRKDEYYTGVQVGMVPAPANPYGIKTVEGILDPDTGEVDPDDSVDVEVRAPFPENPYGLKIGRARWHPVDGSLWYHPAAVTVPLPPNPFGAKTGDATWDANTGGLRYEKLVGTLPFPPNRFGIKKSAALFDLNRGKFFWDTVVVPMAIETPFVDGERTLDVLWSPSNGEMTDASTGSGYIRGRIKLPDGDPFWGQEAEAEFGLTWGTVFFFPDLAPAPVDKRQYFEYAQELSDKWVKRVRRFTVPPPRYSLNTAEPRLDDANVRFSLRTDPPPKKTGIGYKVFYLRNGELYPPMVANPGGAPTPVDVWADADEGARGEDSKTGRKKVKAGGKGTKGGSGTLAWRPGWHLGKLPYALQFNIGKKVPNPLGITNAKGEIIKVGEYFPADLVWAEVEYAADIDYQGKADSYGINKNGNFEHSKAGLPYLPKDGSYEYRTNPNPATDVWVITGAMRVKRILTKDEVDELVRAAGREPQKVAPRYIGEDSANIGENVQKALNNDRKSGKVLTGGTAVYLGETPELFSKLDLPTGKVFAKANTLRKVAKTHGLTAEQIASVSDVMSSPVAIFADEGRGYILLTDVSVPNAKGDNAPLMVYLKPAERGDLEVSAFSGKPSDVSRFVRLANAGEMLYVDNKKVEGLPISGEVKQAISSGSVKPASNRGVKSAEDALNNPDKRYALYWLDPSLEEDPTPIFAQVAAERVATAKLSGKVDPLDGQIYKEIYGVNPEAVKKYVDEYLEKNGRAFQSTEELIQAIGAEAYARQRDNKSLDAYIAGFAEGAGQASYATQLRMAQTEAMKQHMENISGADAWIMQCELGFSLARTVLGMVDAERKMSKEEIAERVKKRRERARKRYLAKHKAEAGDKDAEKLFEQDAATSKDWERYREIFGDPEAMEREVERLKQEAQEQMNADKAEREAQRKKREENKKKKDEKKKEKKPEDEEGKGKTINLEEKLTIPRDFLYAKGIDLADPETLMWFIQQYVMNKWMERENMARTPEEIGGDPRFVRDVQCTLHNALHDLAIDLCYSARRDSVLKRADKILSAGSSLRKTRAIALAAFNAMHATLVKEKREEITKGIIDGIDGTIGRGRFSEKMEQNDRTVSGDFARYLSKIRSILKMSDAEILKQRNKWDAIIRHRSEDLDGKADELLSNKDFNEGTEWIALLDKYGNHNHLMPGELDDLRAELMESVKGELQHTLEERKKFQERIDAVKNNFLLGILDNAPKYKPERARSVFSKRFWDELANAYQSSMHFFLGNLIHRSKETIRKKAKQAQQEIEIQLGQAADKKNYFKSQWMDAIAQEMREIYGSPRACVEALKQKIPENLNAKISKQGNRLTVGQVLMLYAYSQQTDDYHTNIKLHKRDSKEYLDAIRQCLTDKEIALLTSMRNMLVAVFPALQQEYKDITGVTVYTTRNYFPVKMKMDEHLGGDFRFFTPIISAMQPRVRHNRDIDESVDALSLFVSRLEDYSHMLGYGKAGIFLRETLGSTEVLKAVRQAHGDKMYRRLINKTLDILAGTRAQKTSDGDTMAIFLKSSRWVSLVSMSFNIVSAGKQIVSAPMAGAHEDVGIMRASMWLLKALFPDSETRRAWSILRSSPGMIARYGLGLSADLVDAFSGTGRFSKLKKVYDVGMSPITFGDALAGMSCGAGYYLMKEREFMDMGYSQEEAQARAEALTWTLIANTQQSSRAQDQPQIVNNHKVARLLLQFLNAPYQQSQFVVNAFQAMCRGEEGGARRFANVACTMTVVTTLIGLIDLLFDALFGKYHDKDDDEKEEMLKSWAIDVACTAVLNPVFNVPVVGETFHQTVLTLADGKNHFYFMRTGIPVVDKMNDVVRSVTGQLTKPVDWSEMDTVRFWTKGGAEWLDLALKEGLAPYRQLNKSSKNWTGKSILEHAFDE